MCRASLFPWPLRWFLSHRAAMDRLIFGVKPSLALSQAFFTCLMLFFHGYIQEISQVGKELGITPTIIRDEQLKTRGFGGV